MKAPATTHQRQQETPSLPHTPIVAGNVAGGSIVIGNHNSNNVYINSDGVIMRFIDLIGQQAAIINRLTTQVVEQSQEILKLKAQLKGLNNE